MINFNVGIDACTVNPCLNGATCQLNGYGGYLCICPTGYSGATCQNCM